MKKNIKYSTIFIILFLSSHLSTNIRADNIQENSVKDIFSRCDELNKKIASERFIINKQDETIIDKKTGLMWKHCLEGMSGDLCHLGHKNKYSWHESSDVVSHNNANGNFDEYTNWRLPTLLEAKSIQYTRAPDCNLSNITNPYVFPKAGDSTYIWTDTPFHDSFSESWVVDFQSGFVFAQNHNKGNNIRLVRDVMPHTGSSAKN